VLFWASRALSVIAFNILAVAVGWQLYALTGSAFDLGLVGLAHFVPMVALTFVAGHVADRHDRRTIFSICQAVMAVAAAALALGTLGGWLSKASILSIITLLGATKTFDSPALAALLPGLVPRTLLPRATASSASANQTAQIVGPALGGLLYVLGPTIAYATGAALFAAAALLAALIRSPRLAGPREPVTLASLFSGLVFIRHQRVLLGVLSLDLFAVLLGGATALLPIFARDILATGPWGLGLLRAAPACGALIMSLVLARHGAPRPIGPALFGVVAVFGLATVVFGLSTALPLSLVALAVLGASDVVSVVIRFSLVQLRTSDAMRGRVSAVNSMFIGTSNQLGEFESGLLAALLGAVPAVLIGGVGTIVVALAWMVLFPELRRIRTLEE
jgi:MFS family permease